MPPRRWMRTSMAAPILYGWYRFWKEKCPSSKPPGILSKQGSSLLMGTVPGQNTVLQVVCLRTAHQLCNGPASLPQGRGHAVGGGVAGTDDDHVPPLRCGNGGRFTKLPPGGLLTYGIPNMKLPKDIVKRRINLMTDEGVSFVTGVDAADPQVAQRPGNYWFSAGGSGHERGSPHGSCRSTRESNYAGDSQSPAPPTGCRIGRMGRRSSYTAPASIRSRFRLRN